MTATTGKKQVVFLGILVVLAALFIAGYLVMNRPAKNKIITKGDVAPDFRVMSAEGKSVNLSDFRGKVVMVHFWATWCPPCVEEIPLLDRLYQSLRGDEIAMLAISVDEGGAGAVDPFLRKNNLTLPVFYDPGRAIAGSYGTFKFPETYIIDRRGVVKYKIIGPENWADASSLRALRDLIALR